LTPGWKESSPGHKNLLDEIEGVFAFMSVPSLLGKANECKNQSTEGARRFLNSPSWEYLDFLSTQRGMKKIQSRTQYKTCK